MPADDAPLILTLHLDPASQTRFDAERERFFPPERNLIPAHVTLFHNLPNQTAVLSTLAEAAQAQPGFPVAVTGLRSLGRGVAYTLSSPELRALHGQLSRAFVDSLIPQDRQPFRPHVVVQNKATPEAARATLAELTRAFSPWSAQASGLDVWLYLGGPWQHLRTLSFSASEDRDGRTGGLSGPA